MINRKGEWSLVESLANYEIKIAHFRNEFQPHVYSSNEYDVLCLDNIYDFTTTNKINERIFNSRKYAQLILGKDRILINQKHFIECSVLCTENTCPFIYNC